MYQVSKLATYPNCTQCARETRCRGGRGHGRGTSASRRRERRRRRGGGSTGRHSHRSRSSRRTSSRHGSRRASPTRSTRPPPGRRGRPVGAEEEAGRVQVGAWQHSLSFLFSSLSALLGMFSISRFSILTADFGVIFLLQFLLLTLLFGLPMLSLFTSLGQYLGSGIIDMWRISPIFQGVGVSLMLVQGMIGVYSTVVTSWMFVYFRDSFISSGDYKWSFCNYQLPYHQSVRQCEGINHTSLLQDTIPDYFSYSVLHRSNPAPDTKPTMGNMQFQVAFNLVVIWMVIFICLSKGLRSYGKVVYLLTPMTIVGYIVFTSKILAGFQLSEFQAYIQDTNWWDFIYNTKSWVCAAKECFLVWGIFGGSLIQLAAHNKFKHNIKRDTTFILLVVILFLLLSGLLGIVVKKRIEVDGRQAYIPSSFESYSSYRFMLPTPQQIDPLRPPSPSRPHPQDIDHVSYLTGVRILDTTQDSTQFSGYQVNRLATELIPVYFSITVGTISPVWAILFYFTLILLGISQSLALFHTFIQGLIAIRSSTLKNWEGSITFCVCALGLTLGLPIATEIGIFVVYFLDCTVGSGWWVMVLYLLLVFGVLVVRGKPYGSNQISTLLFPRSSICSGWLGPFLAFIWTVILPISLLIMSVVTFKTGHVSDMFDWRVGVGYKYLPSWVREIGSMMQLLPILIVPFVAVIQTCRYFLYSTDSLHTKLEMLYKPYYSAQRRLPTVRSPDVILTNFNPSTPAAPPQASDPPPKYTPPPSYSTATGARLARIIRQSFRRSMRRLQGGGRHLIKDTSSPPDYATVIIESSNFSALGQDSSNFSALGQDSSGYSAPPSEAQEEMYFDNLQQRPVEDRVDLGAFSLDLGLVRLERRESDSGRPGEQDRTTDLRYRHSMNLGRETGVEGGFLALGVGGLLRADSEAVLVETEEPVHIEPGRHEANLTRLQAQNINMKSARNSDLKSNVNSNHSQQNSNPSVINSIHCRLNSNPGGENSSYSRQNIKTGIEQGVQEPRQRTAESQRKSERELDAGSRESGGTGAKGAETGLRGELFTEDAQSYADCSVLEVKNSLRFAAKDRNVNIRDPGPNLGDFFQLRVPEDEFGEIVFVEREPVKNQEEAVNLNVLSVPLGASRGSIRASRESSRGHMAFTRGFRDSTRGLEDISRDKQVILNVDTSTSVI
ncbi:uncharacterized protein LOC111705629 [Eurytemora carolleeae]|uniref:uncharacterized protein LOC111705629 n=1 Tax=Eurytemora carolleeae TaxID=1294199 RepID=UPI000C78BF2F|nr:uncharacterized protein LOC111705629 [Eurytemora carolleeae]|eukprot:XP_023334005.1 uncharacterized protein LOC111705629 [Eurytemora affinis]